ncbi:MAG: PAS domain-containing protein [Syntrophales bacterium]|jgi:two-component system CheB/CheR fusion protein|nr:PAS domain-containing protein [Syntrophales bacterium]MDY0044880.1 CheR family methyltransferase [Syntrophales bacterium]
MKEARKAAKGQKNKAATPPKSTAPVPDKKPFHIVAVGASAGSVDAFERFFTHVPADTGMAFVLVTNLKPDHVSLMTELVQRWTDMEVHQAEDNMPVEPDHVYSIPPNCYLAISQGALHLLEPVDDGNLRLPINYFLRSLAQDQGDRAIGVILSGMGSDGSVGIKAIKEHLGLVIVQHPDTSPFNSMPRSAVATGLADFIVTPEEMGDLIVDFVRQQKETVRPGKDRWSLPGDLKKIHLLLRNHTGHDFSSYKQSTIKRRIDRRMHLHKIDEPSRYIKFLQKNPKEINDLFRELLIGVTTFFRDREAFEELKAHLKQHIKEMKEEEAFRVWILGCASGEEAYSVAIIIKEIVDALDRSLSIQLFATDIDDRAIETARVGLYPEGIATDVGTERLNCYFIKEDGSFRIKKEIREMLVFAPQDAIKDPPFTKLDLVCCRNLLIYLESDLQKKLLNVFHYALKPQGLLFLGTSESIGSGADLFSVADKKWKIFKRRQTADMNRPVLDYIQFPITENLQRAAAEKVPLHRPKAGMAHLVEQNLLKHYIPACMIITGRGKVVYIHGRTGKYLEPAQGEADMNIFQMAREGLKTELLPAVQSALANGEEVVREGIQIKTNGFFQTVNLTVAHIAEPDPLQGHLMVFFKDRNEPQEETPSAGAGKGRDRGREKMERELQYTKESLQSTIEEMETTNEELKSANEELQSTNEELQSANEELETSKEELQSLNEEIVTVNNELQEKNAELVKANNDMKNLLDSIEIPTIFLDNDLNITRFTSHAHELFNLIPSDVGRPLAHIVSNLKDKESIKPAKAVLRDLSYREREVETEDGRWYKMWIFPYRTSKNVIEGLVITFLDIHTQKTGTEEIAKLNRRIEGARKYAQSIIDTVREALVILDPDLRVVSANRSFYRIFGLTEENAQGQPISNLSKGLWDKPELLHLLKEIIPEDKTFDDFEIEFAPPGREPHKIVLNARLDPFRRGDQRPAASGHGGTGALISTIQD